jgi:hypothetical protein
VCVCAVRGACVREVLGQHPSTQNSSEREFIAGGGFPYKVKAIYKNIFSQIIYVIYF